MWLADRPSGRSGKQVGRDKSPAAPEQEAWADQLVSPVWDRRKTVLVRAFELPNGLFMTRSDWRLGSALS